MKTLHELWKGKPPDLSRLQLFGCWSVVLSEQKIGPSKFTPPSKEAILLGFDDTHHSYQLRVPLSNQIKISHHVQFFPTEFPLRNPSSVSSADIFWDIDLFLPPRPISTPESAPLEALLSVSDLRSTPNPGITISLGLNHFSHSFKRIRR